MDLSKALPVLLAVWHFVTSPWFLTSLIPSLVVGLSQYPKTKGFAAKLLTAAQYLSILTHVDSPGTLKLPLTASAAPESK